MPVYHNFCKVGACRHTWREHSVCDSGAALIREGSIQSVIVVLVNASRVTYINWYNIEHGRRMSW